MKTLKRKIGLLVAVLFVGMMAFSSFADTTDTVSVLVKNVPGGALRVGYEDMETGWTMLPIGEEVELPNGTNLQIELGWSGMEWYSSGKDNYYYSELSEVNVKTSDGEGETFSWDGEEYQVQEWTLESDTVIEAEFVAEEEWYGNEPEFWYFDEDDSEGSSGDYWLRPVGKYTRWYDGPTQVEMELKVTCDGEEVSLSDLPLLFFGTDGRNENAELIETMCEELFEFTETGIRSKGELPVGRYDVPISYKSSTEGWINETNVCFIIGKHVILEQGLGAFSYTINDIPTVDYIGSSAYWMDNEEELDNPYNELTNSVSYFDGTKWTVGDFVELIGEDPDAFYIPGVAGYEWTGEFVDKSGNLITASSDTLIKDVAVLDEYTFSPVLKKGSKTYKPATIEPISDSEIKMVYIDCWVEDPETGKWYYYGDNELANSEWIEDTSVGDVFCDSTGALVISGIAGNSMEDEHGLWLVDDKGIIDTSFTGKKTFGIFEYQIEEGCVTVVDMVDVATPSNATEVENLVSGASSVMSQMDDAQKNDIADMISAGLSETANEAVSSELIVEADAVLNAVFGDVHGIETELHFDADEDLGEDDDTAVFLSGSDFNVTGIFAAAGYTIAHAEANVPVAVELKQLKVSTASNASAKEVLRFDAKLTLGGNKVQLKSPLLFVIKLSESFLEQFPLEDYTFTVNHYLSNGRVEKISPEIYDDGMMYIRANSLSEFALTVKEKVKSTPSYSGSHTVSKKKETVEASAVITGEWVQDAIGWWYRNTDGTWPKSQWEELEWNGTKNWYYFNENGYMATGWILDGGFWYYLHPTSDGTQGYMYTDWNQIGGVWYYFNPNIGGPKGSMLADTTTPDGYKVDANGAWIQ